jgi:hypothetical protein
MSTLHVYSNRHIKDQVVNIKKGDWVYLENSLSAKRWSLYFNYNNINEKKLKLTYITHNDFFSEDIINKMKVKINRIVGNVPYQDKEGNENSTNSADLFVDFVYHAFGLDVDEISYIIPSDWTGPNTSNFKKYMFSKGLETLTFLPDGTFDAHVNTCSFTYNKNHIGNCKVIDINGIEKSINLANETMISDTHAETDFIKKFPLNKNMSYRWLRGSINKNQIVESNKGVELIRNVGKLNEELDDIVIIDPLIENTGYGIKKVVLPNMGTDSEKLGAIKIAENNHVGGHSVVFLTLDIDETHESIISYLNSNIIKALIKSIKSSTPNSKSVFSFIPDLKFNKIYTDQEIATIFNLSEDDVKYVESNY